MQQSYYCAFIQYNFPDSDRLHFAFGSEYENWRTWRPQRKRGAVTSVRSLCLVLICVKSDLWSNRKHCKHCPWSISTMPMSAVGEVFFLIIFVLASAEFFAVYSNPIEPWSCKFETLYELNNLCPQRGRRRISWSDISFRQIVATWKRVANSGRIWALRIPLQKYQNHSRNSFACDLSSAICAFLCRTLRGRSGANLLFVGWLRPMFSDFRMELFITPQSSTSLRNLAEGYFVKTNFVPAARQTSFGSLGLRITATTLSWRSPLCQPASVAGGRNSWRFPINPSDSLHCRLEDKPATNNAPDLSCHCIVVVSTPCFAAALF